MEELFRFTITRPAERTNATTLPLERRSPFQEELVSQAAEGRWQLLEETALIYIQGNLPWILTLTGQTPDAPIPVLKQLLSDLQAVQAGSPSDTWQVPIQTAVDQTTPDQLDETNESYATSLMPIMGSRHFLLPESPLRNTRFQAQAEQRANYAR